MDDCKELERLFHSKLTPLRQKRREFFNINPDDAYTALTSLLERQENINEIDEPSSCKNDIQVHPEPKMRKRYYYATDSEYAEIFHSFVSALNVKGRPFDQTNKPYFGISDGNEGVQWNLRISRETDEILLGVNLEGMEYAGWPIATFISSELYSSELLEVQNRLKKPEAVYIHFTRDAWWPQGRATIAEQNLGSSPFSFFDATLELWTEILKDAQACLNVKSNFRGRTKQQVTLKSKTKNNGQVRSMWVTPHLTVRTPVQVGDNIRESIEQSIKELTPVYYWVNKVCQSGH